MKEYLIPKNSFRIRLKLQIHVINETKIYSKINFHIILIIVYLVTP
jgi:hypothetical protein